MKSNPLVQYKLCNQLSPPPHTSTLYEYLFAGNGVFLRSQREGLSAIIPINLYSNPVHGLAHLQPHIEIQPSPIPKAILLNLWRQSCLARSENGLMEILFHLHTDGEFWQLITPEQTQSSAHCQTTQSYLQSAIAEIHSHGAASAYFSATDNQEENGFRLYGVVGRLNTFQPEILVRIGIYSHFLILPASTIFELPNFFVDVAERDRLTNTFYSRNQP